MKQKRLLPIILFLLSVFFPAQRLSAANIEIVVPTQYSTIQSAIDYAYNLLTGSTGTTNSYSVLVEPGTYAANVTLRSNIPIRGRETARTVLSGGGSGTAISANGVTNVSISNFTIISASVGIDINNSTITVNNNVFSVGLSGIGIQAQNSASSTVTNNTFIQNGEAIRSSSDLSITNNIFFRNTTALFTLTPLVSLTHVSFSLFHDNGTDDNVSYVLSQSDPNTSTNIPSTPGQNTDPLFVDSAKLPPDMDLHIMESISPVPPSPCIDAGTNVITANDSFDGTRNDIGAYGGPGSDTIPFLVSLQTATLSATDPNAIDVTWTENKSYLVKNSADPGGYKVYYSLNKSGEPYDASVTLVSTATSTTLTGLNSTPATPTAPTLIKVDFSNGALTPSWNAVPGATGYKIYYTDTVTSIEQPPIDVGNQTSYDISGLINYRDYSIAVTAYTQNTYYIAVTAFDSTAGPFEPGKQHESAYSSPEAVVKIGSLAESTKTYDPNTYFPEPIEIVPSLPNTGCFIATAAYGRYSAPQVQILRDFRDRYLVTNAAGRAFVGWYYHYSPALAGFINEHPALKPVVRAALLPAVGGAMFMTRTPLTAKVIVFLLFGIMIVYLSRKARKNLSRANEVQNL